MITNCECRDKEGTAEVAPNIPRGPKGSQICKEQDVYCHTIIFLFVFAVPLEDVELQTGSACAIPRAELTTTTLKNTTVGVPPTKIDAGKYCRQNCDRPFPVKTFSWLYLY